MFPTGKNSPNKLSKMFKKLLIVFISAFILNMIWEHVHSLLYFHPNGDAITSSMLIRAALFDAFIITFFVYTLKKTGYVIGIAILFAIGLEVWAIEIGRWAYTEHMPTIFGVGLSPAIQLALTAYISLKISDYSSKSRFFKPSLLR